MIKVENLSFSYGENEILKNIDFEVVEGKLNVIIGPNGSGKSTLMNVLCRNLEFSSGVVDIDGKSLSSYSHLEYSRKVASISQNMDIKFPFTCSEIVMMGRYPHKRKFGRYSKSDFKSVEESMNLTEVYDYKERMIGEISGGEKQRVFLAKALAQETDIILLDEAFSNMDINYKISSLRLLKKIIAKRDLTVVAIIHDLHLVNMFADYVIALKDGEIVYKGSSTRVIAPDVMKNLFDINIKKTDLDELIITA